MPVAQEGALHLTRSRIHTAFPTSPSNPNTWTKRKQWTVIPTVSVSGFISTCASSIAVPTVHAIGAEFGEKNEKVSVLITSLYVLGLG
jgi:DHA1 family multidrug resistance protein-like MFS transporter